MKYFNTAITELTEQYRTILKKCVLLNAMVIIFLFSLMEIVYQIFLLLLRQQNILLAEYIHRLSVPTSNKKLSKWRKYWGVKTKKYQPKNVSISR